MAKEKKEKDARVPRIRIRVSEIRDKRELGKLSEIDDRMSDKGRVETISTAEFFGHALNVINKNTALRNELWASLLFILIISSWKASVSVYSRAQERQKNIKHSLTNRKDEIQKKWGLILHRYRKLWWAKKKAEWHRRDIKNNMEDRLFNEEMNPLQEEGERRLFELFRQKYCPTESYYAFQILGIKFFETQVSLDISFE